MAEAEPAPKQRQLLPTNVTPVGYWIHVSPHFEKEKLNFDGEAKIQLKVNESSKKIQFHSLDVEYSKFMVGDEEIDMENGVSFNKKDETCTLSLQNEIVEGTTVELRAEYIGQLNDKMKGFYRSKYKKGDEEVFGGITQFESTDARRAFPCWDEPAVKSKFTVQITAGSIYTILSNMPETSRTENDDGTVTVLFDESPTMSSYLVAWVVGEYEYIETTTKRGLPVRTYAPIGKKDQGKLSVDFAAKVLDWYEEYFQIDYPLPKLDMVACADFAAGAMENWGLVTYREARVLVSETTGPRSIKFIYQVIAHELAHQWFGNLVTMDWWKELWLNEGFANWMESYCSDHLTDLDFKSFIVTKSLLRALSLDAMLTSHPIQVDIATAAEVDEIFDAISYCKGGSLVRMIQTYLGEKTFQKGLQTYMQEFQYNNATTNDLWKHLSKASGVDVGSTMKNWTEKQGFPVITASLNDAGNLVLRQNRFLSSCVPSAEQDQIIWNIPIVALTPEGEKRIVLTEREIIVEDINASSWIHLNHGYTGFYRVNYSAELLQRLNKALVDGALTDQLDRLCLINDVLELTKGNDANATSILELLSGYKNETSQAVWESICSVVGDLKKLIEGEPEEELMDKLLRELLGKIKDDLGWEVKESDAPERNILRGDILGLCDKANFEDVRKTASEKFWAYFNENKEFPASLRKRIIATTGKHGGEKEYDVLHKRYVASNDDDEKRDLVCGMSMNKDQKLHKKLLDFMMTDAIKKQNKVFPLAYLSMNPTSKRYNWQFVQDNWATLYGFFEGGFLVAWVAKTAQTLTTLEDADQVEEFFKSVRESAPAANRAMDQTVEAIRVFGSWRQRDLQPVKDWLKGNVSS